MSEVITTQTEVTRNISTLTQLNIERETTQGGRIKIGRKHARFNRQQLKQIKESSEFILGAMVGDYQSDGCFSALKSSNGNNSWYQVRIVFTNTDDDLLNGHEEYLKKYIPAEHIHRYYYTPAGNAKEACNMTITNHASNIKLLQLMKPYLKGKKQEVAQAILDYYLNGKGTAYDMYKTCRILNHRGTAPCVIPPEFS